jgi:hypothetical protein
MLTFTRLERAVLRRVCVQHPEHASAIEAQLREATVSSRENTGCGFFTRLEIGRSAAPLSIRDGNVGNVWAKVPGFHNPMTFVLFVVGGYVGLLEGATVGDLTAGLDLGAIEFEIVQS